MRAFSARSGSAASGPRCQGRVARLPRGAGSGRAVEAPAALDPAAGTLTNSRLDADKIPSGPNGTKQSVEHLGGYRIGWKGW